MAAVAITTSSRDTILRKVRDLVDELIAVNNRAIEWDAEMDDLSSTEATTIDALLAGGTSMAAQISGILAGSVTVLVNNVATTLSWTHTEG